MHCSVLLVTSLSHNKLYARGCFCRCQVLSIPVSEWTVPIFCGSVLGVGIAVLLHIKDAFDYVTASRGARRRVGE